MRSEEYSASKTTNSIEKWIVAGKMLIAQLVNLN
jgi:hypothetical protein